MRFAGWAPFILAMVLIAGLPASAKPLMAQGGLPKVHVHDTLVGMGDERPRAMTPAFRMVRELRAELTGLQPAANGALDIRMSFVQPVVRGQVDFLSLLWVATHDTPWTGVYWIETSAGVRTPKLLTTNAEGVLLFLDAGVSPLSDDVEITYHFLGIDGRHVRHHVGTSHVLDAAPVKDHADFGAAVASHVGHPPEGLFLTPWNTLGRNATLGLSLMADARTLDEALLVGCDDRDTTITERGCRLLYVMLLQPELTSIRLWHLDERGERVLDRELGRAELLSGYQYSL